MGDEEQVREGERKGGKGKERGYTEQEGQENKEREEGGKER